MIHRLVNISGIMLLLAFCLGLSGCDGDGSRRVTLFERACYPYAVFYGGKYYYTMQSPDCDEIRLWVTDDLHKLGSARNVVVWKPTDARVSQHIWSPELHRIGGKWYIYFEADDGNTDNHQLYVIESGRADPTAPAYRLHGPIITNREWNFGLHPTTLVVRGRQYLAWSGWQHRRSETEVQCIFIARMRNPWTLDSPRVMVSRPEYEWERQWINFDGSSAAYPIYVNENPELMLSADGRSVIIYYSASGCWTIYTALGMLTAPVGSDLTNPRSWSKSREPVFAGVPEDSVYSPSDICIVRGPGDSAPQLLYEAKRIDRGQVVKEVRLKSVSFDAKGFPVFGRPL